MATLAIPKYKKPDIKFAKLKLGSKQRADLYKMLATFLSNGVGEVDALENLWQMYSRDGRKPTEVVAVALGCWYHIKVKGVALTDAMVGWVPEQERMIIMAGEQSGSMSMALRRCAKSVRDNNRIAGAVRKSMAYPMCLVLGTIGLLAFYTFSVLPTYANILPMEHWRGSAAALAFVAFAIRNYWWLFGSLGITFIFAVFWSMPRWTKRCGKLRQILDNFPPYSLYRMQQSASFVTSIGALLEGGVPLQTAMQTVATFGGDWFKARVMAAERLRARGNDLGVALKGCGYNFPDQETTIKIACYAKASSLEKALVSIGEEMVEDGVEKLEAKSAFIQFLAMFLVTLVLLWISFALFEVGTQIRASVT